MTEDEILSKVERLLTEVTSASDTKVLNRATKELRDNFYKSPFCIPVLVHILQTSHNVAVRQLAAVETKKLVKDHWSEDFAPQIRASLLPSTLGETDAKTRHASARLISAIGKMDMQEGRWPELAFFCQQASTSARASDREVGLFVIFSLFETEPEFFEERLEDLLQLFQHTIMDPESREVRQTTLRCLGELSARIYDKDKTLIKGFREALHPMTVVLNQAIEAEDEMDARYAFEVFENLLIVESSLLSKNLRDILQFFVGICANTNLDPEYREMALSFLSTAIRYKRQRIQSLKLGPDLLLAMLHIAMEPDDNDLDEDSPVRLAIVNILILSNNLPPTHVIPPLLEQFPKLATSANPYERRGAMAALGAVMEGSPDFMADYIEDLLPLVFRSLRDPEGTVIRTALVTLGQITDELPTEVTKHHVTMVPVVFELLGSNNLEIVKAACSSLDAILEWVPKEAVEQYLPKLMEALLYILTTDVDADVKIIVAAAIGTAAHASKEGFFVYLDSSMHTFFNMKEVIGAEHHDLRGCVTDTLGTIASAVGKDKFLPYMDKSFHLAFEGLKMDSSRLRESAFVFFAVMADVLKAELVPVLPQIMPSLIETLNQEDLDFGDNQITEEEAKRLLNGNDDAFEESDDDDDDESVELNVNSALQLEKEIAADSLGEIFINVKGGFLPYLQTATEQLLELADSFYDGARKSALSALWHFVVTLGELQITEDWQPGLPLKVALPSDVAKLTEVVRKKTMDTLKEEGDRDVMAEIFRSLSDAMTTLGPGVLGDDGNELAAITLMVLQREHPCQRDDDDEEPPQDDEDMAEIESVLLDAAVDVVIALAKVLTDQFAHAFDPFYRRLIHYTRSKSSSERAMAVAGLGEITGALGGGVSKHTGEMLSIFLAATDDSALDVSSNAIYGLGLLLESTPQNLSSQYNAILNKLQRFFPDTAPQNAKDNAVGCVSRMILRHPQAVPLDVVLPAIVHCLPLKDVLENEPTYQMIIQLYHANNHIMLQLTEHVLPAFSKVLADDKQVKTPTRVSLLELVKALREQYPHLFQSYPGLMSL